MDWSQWLNRIDRINRVYRGMQLLAPEYDVGEICWTLWIDPGTHTGLGAVVYYKPPLIRTESGDLVSGYGQAVRAWYKSLRESRELGVSPRADDLCYDACGALVLAYWSEFTFGDENAMVRSCVSRTRELGAVFAGTLEWSSSDSTTCLGRAGVGAEGFTNLRADRSWDYLSPVRVTAAFRYAVDDEFGIQLKTNSSGDALGNGGFSRPVLEHLGVSADGPDHSWDGLGHGFFGIRKFDSGMA